MRWPAWIRWLRLMYRRPSLAELSPVARHAALSAAQAARLDWDIEGFAVMEIAAKGPCGPSVSAGIDSHTSGNTGEKTGSCEDSPSGDPGFGDQPQAEHRKAGVAAPSGDPGFGDQPQEVNPVEGVERPSGDPGFGDQPQVKLEFHIPKPPSVNALYGNASQKGRRGRFKTPAYAAWLAEAGYALNRQSRRWKPLAGPVKVALVVNKGRADLSNLEKAPLDLMTAHRIYNDDSQVVALSMFHDPQADEMYVTVEAA